MKVNKWTLGLAAVGLVSLASVAKAEEAAGPVLTALSATTISGYVDTAAHWNPGSGTLGPQYSFAAGKRDGFNVNLVALTIEKPLEEGEWSAGYKVDLLFGPDSTAVNTGGGDITERVRQAYVNLRVPVGNGLDFKIGRWDTIVGYESTDSYKNPNYTRNYEYTLTPTEHTGILATYQATDWLALNFGVANTYNTFAINTKSPRAETHKAYMASAAITVPEDWGFLAGSTFYAGVMDGFGSTGKDASQYYAAMTIMTGIEGLRFGAAYSFFDNPSGAGTDTWTANLYASFLFTDKLGLHFRGEYGHGVIPGIVGIGNSGEIMGLTATLQYDIWENVLTRLEVRWDHDASGSPVRPFGEPGDVAIGQGKRNDFLVALNFVYKF
jgi:hypothetical protein